MGINPDGTMAPIKVSLVDIADPVQSRLVPVTKVNRDKVLITNSFLLTVGAAPVNLLGHTPKRCRAQVIVNGTTGSVIAFGTSQSDVEGAQNTGTGQFQGDVAYVNGNYPGTIPIDANSELWCALITAGSGPTIVSAFKEIDT